MAFICHIRKVVVGGFWKRSIHSAEGFFGAERAMKMRGKILCVLCMVLVAACGVARPQEGDVSTLLYQRELRDYQKAAAMFEQYIGEHTSGISLWQCYISLAKCYAALGLKEDASAPLETAQELVPTEDLRQECAQQIFELREEAK